MPKGLAGFPKAVVKIGQMTYPFIEKTWCAPSLINHHAVAASNSFLSNTLFCAPLLFDVPVFIDGWFTNVSGAVNPSTIEAGLYSVRPGGRPDQLITRLGLIDSSTTGDKQVACNPTFIPAGPAFAVFYSADAVTMTAYATGHSGVRITDPAIFLGYPLVGLNIGTNKPGLPYRFTGIDVLLGTGGNSNAPFIAFSIYKVLA